MFRYYIDDYGVVEAIERQHPELKEKPLVAWYIEMIKMHEQALADLAVELLGESEYE